MGDERKVISKRDEKAIVKAIKVAESETSGEIRVHIEPDSKGEPLHERAKNVFHQLKMHETRLHNGVLIYLAVNDRKFFIIGDKGIHKKVPDNFWEDTRNIMQVHFRNGDFKQGLIDGILMAGEQLQKFFPHTTDDINELSDEISRG